MAYTLQFQLRMVSRWVYNEKEKRGIINFYDHRISTCPIEGRNNKIKTLQKQTYGFRDHEFFKLKIYGFHKTKYALVG